VFEWAVNSLKANLDTRFDVAGMRYHLIRCLERRGGPFPPNTATTTAKAAGSTCGSNYKIHRCLNSLYGGLIYYVCIELYSGKVDCLT